MPRALLRSNSCSSSLASNLSGVSPSSENSPLSHMKSAGEEQCHCFSQNSAGGKPLPVVNGEKHIKFFHLHLSQGKSSVGNFAAFQKVMNQGNESCIRDSNILHGTKAALAMFRMLSADKRDSVTTEAKSFYKAMANMSKDSGSAKSAEKELEKFNKALLKASGLTNKSADIERALDDLFTGYLHHFVYSDVIDKLSGVITPEQLEVIKGNPEQAVNTLYSTLNESNNLMTGLLSEGFLAHQGVNDKAARMHELITKLEHKTEIIAGIISNSLASDSPAASANADLPESPLMAPEYNMAPLTTPAQGTYSPAPEFNMASPTTPNSGIQLPAISSVISPVFSPVFNNNFGELAPALDKIADVLERVISLENRLLPGKVNVERTELGTQTPDAPLESDLPTYAEVVQSRQPDNTGPKRVDQSMIQQASNDDDETDSVSTRSAVAPQPETPAMAVPKKTTSSLSAQGTFFGTQGAVLPKYSDATPVALTNGAISGSSQSTSYRNSDTNRVAYQSKIAPLADTKIEGSPQPDNIQAKPMAPLMAKPMDQKVLTNEDDIDGASTPPPVAAQPEAPVMTQAKKATYSLNAQGNPVGTNGALSSYKDVPRVAMTNGAVVGTTPSVSYAKSDTNGFVHINSSSTNEQLAEALKKREELSAKPTQSLSSAGTPFMGLYSDPSRPPINLTPKNKTTEYRLNESLSGNAN